MTPIKLTILGRTPSKKNTHRRKYSRKLGRWIIAADSKSYLWECQAIIQLIQQKNKLGLETITYKINLNCQIYLSTYRRKDLTNMIQSVEDALEKATIIKNDFQVESLDYSRRVLGVPVEDERVEIFIKEF
jgi:Holliday junction resolvase RusA-like endonuclease